MTEMLSNPENGLIFITGLDQQLQETDVIRYFRTYGVVVYCVVVRDNRNISSGHAVLKMGLPEMRDEACEEVDQVIFNSHCKVSPDRFIYPEPPEPEAIDPEQNQLQPENGVQANGIHVNGIQANGEAFDIRRFEERNFHVKDMIYNFFQFSINAFKAYMFDSFDSGTVFLSFLSFFTIVQLVLFLMHSFCIYKIWRSESTIEERQYFKKCSIFLSWAEISLNTVIDNMATYKVSAIFVSKETKIEMQSINFNKEARASKTEITELKKSVSNLTIKYEVSEQKIKNLFDDMTILKKIMFEKCVENN